MIKSLPGWINFLLLSVGYAIVVFLLRWFLKSQCEDWFLVIMVTIYAGGYLAKWRYYKDGSLKFW